MAYNLYFWPTRATMITRNGQRISLEQRSRAVWDHCIENHRRDAHQGKRSDTCNACLELERKRDESR